MNILFIIIYTLIYLHEEEDKCKRMYVFHFDIYSDDFIKKKK